MDICFLIPGLGGSGGAERSLLENLPYYVRKGIRTIIVVLREKVAGEREAGECGAEVIRLPGGSLRSWVPAFRRLVADRNPSLIYTSLWDADLIGRLGRVGRRNPVISSLVNNIYDPTGLEQPTAPTYKRRIAELIDRYSGRFWTTHYHAVAAAVRDCYVEKYGIAPERITVVPRGRSRTRLGEASHERRTAVRTRIGVPHDAQLLVNVGRHGSQKDQRTFIDAVAQLQRSRPNIQAMILGEEGAMTGALRNQITRLGLGDCVHLLGHREDVADIVAAADVFVFPSLREGAAGALLEAMALARPIVASDIPPLREPITAGETGELVPAGDAAAFAAATARLLDDPLRATALGTAACRKFDAEYSTARSAERMITMFYDVVSQGAQLRLRHVRDN